MRSFALAASTAAVIGSLTGCGSDAPAANSPDQQPTPSSPSTGADDDDSDAYAATPTFSQQGADEWDCTYLLTVLSPEFADLEPLGGVGGYGYDGAAICSYKTSDAPFISLDAICGDIAVDGMREAWASGSPVLDGPSDVRERMSDRGLTLSILRDDCIFSAGHVGIHIDRGELLELVSLLADRFPRP